MALTFGLTFDYRCPFARNAHEHVLVALREGAPWDVRFLPFSLNQAHVPEGGTPVWEDPGRKNDLLALLAGVVVRERYPDQFFAVHEALFAARHDLGGDLREEKVVRDALGAGGVDPGPVLAEIDAGWPLEVTRAEHEQAVHEHQVFGVPTFVFDDQAIFVRIMTRPEGDAKLARATVDHVLGLAEGHPELNEYKHTSISR